MRAAENQGRFTWHVEARRWSAGLLAVGTPRLQIALTLGHMPARRDRIRGSRLLGRCMLGLGWGLLGVGAASAALYTVPSLQLANRYTVMAAAFIPYGLVAFGGASVIFATSSKRWPDR